MIRVGSFVRIKAPNGKSMIGTVSRKLKDGTCEVQSLNWPKPISASANELELLT